MELVPNADQQRAIDLLENPVMLLAGPGTGKTFTVIRRIEKMLASGIEPSSILCLTFSDAAANEMRQRLIKKMGVAALGVDVYTYHSFCNEIIKNYPSQFEMASGVRLITETEKIKLMRECIDQANLECFVPQRGDKYYFTKNFIEYVEKLKSKRLKKEEYFDFIKNSKLVETLKELEAEYEQKKAKGRTATLERNIESVKRNIGKAKELWTIYELYKNKMFEKSLIDFSDMIILVLDAFENDEMFLSEVSNKYKYFLVDEYQDTSDMQNSIIFNLVDGNKEKNIFVVGDDDQIIYGFQGAKIDSIENFLNKYPETEVICLKESNRSTPSILKFSYDIISQDKNRLENNDKFKKEKNISKKLTAKNPDIIPLNKKVRVLNFGANIQETNHIIDEIDELIKSDKYPLNDDGEKDLSKIAIISKKRAELQTYGEMLKGKNIPYQIDEGKSIFAIRSSILIYFYMKALTNPAESSDKLFGLLLSEPFKLEIEDYNKILHEKQIYRENEPDNFLYLMKKLDNWKNSEKINKFLDDFKYLTEYAQTNSLRNTVIEIINRTGILEAFYKEEKNRMENLMGIKKIIDEATEYEKLDHTKNLLDFVNYLYECWVEEIDVTTDKSDIIQNAVQLTTYHGSKGREFDYVYLPNLISRNWEKFSMPGEYKLITEEVLEKEEAQEKKDSELYKLLYVGITRAKHSLTLSYSNMDGKRQNEISKYIAKYKNFDCEEQTFEYKEDDFTKEFFRNISRDVFDNQKAFRDEINERIKKVELSPSRLNDYLECPRKFFYTKILGINVEDANWDNANFGTIIHKILEDSVKIAKSTGKYPEIEEVKTMFCQALENEKFTSKQAKEKFEKRGNKIIESYYPHFKNEPIERIADIEFSFNGVQVGDDLISGKIDRIEKNSDGTYCLYDYKTGTPASASKFAPGEEKEGYYNQLCFYKYAFEKMTGKKVAQTGIIYVENHTKNVNKELCEEDMNYIEDKIKTTYKNIKEMKFDPIKETNEGACKFCAYKQLCRLDLI